MSLESLSMDHPRALTFHIDNKHFGIDVSNILSFSDTYHQVRPAISPAPGLSGFLDYRSQLIQVFECSFILGCHTHQTQPKNNTHICPPTPRPPTLTDTPHPVILHLTQDGATPWFALVLEEIDDIIEYETQQLDRSIQTLGHEPVIGYVRHNSSPPFMMLDVIRLYRQLTADLSGNRYLQPSPENTVTSNNSATGSTEPALETDTERDTSA
ncbi:MAG: chemotaxis protein CheW [Marinobacterium sp.]|nr:chemotaxis protein CheW [Marinobacterium sp.]